MAIVSKAFKPSYITIFFNQFIHWPGIECPCGASGDTRRSLTLAKTVDTQVTFDDVYPVSSDHFGRIIGTSLNTELTGST